MQTLTQKLANPTRFMQLSGRLLPWLAGLAALLLVVAMWKAWMAPPDDRHGHTVKIMFVHVPSAWLAMMGYALIALSSFGLLVFRHPLADVSAKAAAPVGAAFTFLALVTGSLWGKGSWGTYWVWDARLTSVLLLFFLYLGLIALRSSVEDEALAAKLTAVLALVGIAILPFIKISVEGLCIESLGIKISSWNPLHQPSSILSTCPQGRGSEPAIRAPFFAILMWSAAAFTVLFFTLHIKAMRNEILRRRVSAMRLALVERTSRLEPHPAE